ncbi:MAG: hypothetical protein FWH14_08560 [Oscillospiraceae bacterium]|nr:hypothetical protein [Oscillospiraceae bacterium]
MIINKKHTLFSAKNQPCCKHCLHSKVSASRISIICKYKGLVSADFSCGRFVYDPLKRSPNRLPPMPGEDFSAEDFDLNDIESDDKTYDV